MHVQSVTFISEYNQTYHTSHLVIIVYILLCVSITTLYLMVKSLGDFVFTGNPLHTVRVQFYLILSTPPSPPPKKKKHLRFLENLLSVN